MTAARILHITDPHLFAEADGELRGVRTAGSLASVLRAARSQDDPDAVLVTGDIAQDETREAYVRFRQVLGEGLADSGAAVFCLPGNHDDPALMRQTLAEPPFQTGGIARLGNWRIHLLSTWVAGAASGRLDIGQLAALDADLTAHGEAPALICLHHHPVPTGSRWLDRLALEEPAELLQVADSHSQVRALVWGHVHQNMDDSRGHYRLIATPSTCRQFRPDSDTFDADDRPPAWRWLYLAADGTLDTSLSWLHEED